MVLRGSSGPLLYFAAVHLDGFRATGTDEVMMVSWSAGAIKRFTVAIDAVDRSFAFECLERTVHRGERRSLIAQERVQFLGRNEFARVGEGRNDCRALFSGAPHELVLVLFHARDVDVIIVVFDAVFRVEVIMDFTT